MACANLWHDQIIKFMITAKGIFEKIWYEPQGIAQCQGMLGICCMWSLSHERSIFNQWAVHMAGSQPYTSIDNSGFIQHKDCLSWYNGSLYKDKAVKRPSYLRNVNLYNDKMASLYWISSHISRIEIHITKLRQPCYCLIFPKGIPILVRWHTCMKTTSALWLSCFRYSIC